ncbi:hypothetical protein F5Y17DRAFT_251912 [Xylariaceae sp. FL0594]|nr:hypothetical protein F5Y17DRAFT_251912 [Xylariaceae sp. FL0594]
MQPEEPRPELSTIQFNRKFGRYDFHRFDHLVREHASVGAATLGRVNVDCRFLFEKSRWGTLKGSDSAGIIYLDLAFHQPSDCRLKSATVQVTLDDDDEHLLREFPARESRLPVQIDKYGPREMSGKPEYERIAVHNSLIPTISVGNIGTLDGMGRENFRERLRECRWQFESHLMTGTPRTRKRGNDNRMYRVIQWQVKENELQDQSQQSNTIHTAFSFVHGGQPFFMRVEVSGKLESRRSDFRHQMKDVMKRLKFPPNPKSAECATTLIHFSDPLRFKTPLDDLNRQLELTMVHANMTSPVEIDRFKWGRTMQDARAGSTAGFLTPRPYTSDGIVPAEVEEATPVETNESIAELSSKYLMAPPIRPAVTIPMFRRAESVQAVSPEPEPTRPQPAEPQPEPEVRGEEPAAVPEVSPETDQLPEGKPGTQADTEHEQARDEEHKEEGTGEEEQKKEKEEAQKEGQDEKEEEEEEAEPVANGTITRPRGPKRRVSSDDKVDLVTVVFLVRIWVVQTIATFFGFGGGRSES